MDTYRVSIEFIAGNFSNAGFVNENIIRKFGEQADGEYEGSGGLIGSRDRDISFIFTDEKKAYGFAENIKPRVFCKGVYVDKLTEVCPILNQQRE